MSEVTERQPSRTFHRYLAKSRKRRGGLICTRCEGRFGGRDAYDRHLVWYSEGITDSGGPGEWCHMPEEVGLVGTPGGWWRLPSAGGLVLDPWIEAGAAFPVSRVFPNTFRTENRGQNQPPRKKQMR